MLKIGEDPMDPWRIFRAPEGQYLLDYLRLKRRALVPRWFGDLVLWVFFHRVEFFVLIDIPSLADQRFRKSPTKYTDPGIKSDDSFGHGLMLNHASAVGHAPTIKGRL